MILIITPHAPSTFFFFGSFGPMIGGRDKLSNHALTQV